MDLFKYINERVTARQVVEFYGIAVDGHGFCRCPFHNDRHPSMKADRKFHCFGCGAHGDAIDFVSRYFSLPLKDAVQKIIDDFRYGSDAGLPVLAKPKPEPPDVETKQQWLLRATDILFSYRDYLQSELTRYAPRTPDEAISPHMAETAHSLEQVEYALELATDSDESVRERLYYEAKEVIDEIGRILKTIMKRGNADGRNVGKDAG